MATPYGYGRTRRPKALVNDGSVVNKQTATSVTVVEPAELNDDINDGTSGENGYSTENQRYLHLHLTGDDDSAYSATIYGYNYAFGSWARLYIPCRHNTAEGTWKPALFNTIDDASGGPKHIIVEIAGIDRIAVVANASHQPKITARMSCTSF